MRAFDQLEEAGTAYIEAARLTETNAGQLDDGSIATCYLSQLD
jgi:hypothetical protein